jgi:hypothetical protein
MFAEVLVADYAELLNSNISSKSLGTLCANRVGFFLGGQLWSSIEPVG